MPPSPAYDNTTRVTQTLLLPNGDIAENVFHFFMAGAAGGFDGDDADIVATAVQGAWDLELKGLTSTAVRYLRLVVQDLRNTPYPTWQFDYTVTGSDASPMLAAQLAIVASLHTEQPGRSGRGRAFLAGFCEDSNAAAGVIEATTISAVEDWATAMRADITTANHVLQWGVLSRLLEATNIISSVNVDARWDVQRRRANRRL